METLKKVKGEKTWHDFIFESAVKDSIKEIEEHGINALALRGLCLKYDLEYGPYNMEYEGYSILKFFCIEIAKVEIKGDIEDWIDRLREMEKKEVKKQHMRNVDKE